MKRYNKYKPSGIEWIGDIPEHWEVKKIKFISSIQGRIGFKGYSVQDIVTSGEGALTLGAKHISKDNKINLSDPEFISWDKYYESPEIMLKTGDLLVVQRGSLGKVALLETLIGEATINPSLLILRDTRVLPKFLLYYLSSNFFLDFIKLINSATAVPMISQQQLGDFKLPVCNNQEQTLIAAFLDRKTAEIDLIIANKQKLIALYEEEKQAVINQAVTKGLAPNVKLKDSGVEWLGEIPEHWEVKKLKYIIQGFESGVSVNSLDIPIIEDEFGILKTSCVYDYTFRPHENKVILNEEEVSRARTNPKKGQIIISRMNTPELVGASGYVEKDYPNLFLPDRLWQTVLIEKVQIDSKWLSYILKSYNFRKLLSILATGTSPSMKNIGQEDVLNIPIPFPEIVTQNSIVAHIEKECARLDTIIEKFNKQIDLLQEYRTTLISEVVTGKIKVS